MSRYPVPYPSESKGFVEIESMNGAHLRNTAAKIEREIAALELGEPLTARHETLPYIREEIARRDAEAAAAAPDPDDLPGVEA